MRLILLLALAAPLYAQADLEQLYSEERYEEVVAATNDTPADADTLFYRGIALGQLQRWEEADAALRGGWRVAPRDARFPTELAGVAYRLERRRDARRFLRQSLRLEPDDEYALNFLGSLYLLDDNVDAALAQWNRFGRPVLSTIETPASLHTDAALLDRALAFSPSEVLELDELYTSRARLGLLDAFSTYDVDLAPEGGGEYKLRLRGFERRGWSGSPWLRLARAARGLPYQTVFLEYDNGPGDASSLHALARWDDNRRRARVSYSRPLLGEARYRWSVFADARDENWALARSDALSELGLQRAEVGASFDSVVNGSFQWGAEFAAAVRSFAGEGTDSLRTPDALGGRTDVFFRWTPLRLPARRITVATDARLGVGATGGERYGRSEGAAELRWTSGGDWNFRSRLAAGALPGRVPFDELYILGVERDNPLDFRGIAGATDGRKGSAPLGDRYWLSSTDLTRRIGRFSLLDIHAGPFFDVGLVADSRDDLGSGGVQAAVGVQLELRLFGAFGVKLLYGRDLRNGGDVFFSRPYPDRDLR